MYNILEENRIRKNKYIFVKVYISINLFYRY